MGLQDRAKTWAKTGIAVMRDTGLSELPGAVLALGPACRVLNVLGNCLQSLPISISGLSNLRTLVLSGNALTSDGIPWCGPLASAAGLTRVKCHPDCAAHTAHRTMAMP
jgi:hypothetical protein